jgi:hypothetical protein
LKILRKDRERALKRKEFFQYLKYSFGEVLIVVLGILIAIQLNNWNEQAKNKQNILVYFQKIKDEIESVSPLISINSDFTKDSIINSLKTARKIVRFNQTDSLSILFRKITWLTESESLTFQFPVLDEFSNKGYLSAIDDNKLNELFLLLKYAREQSNVTDELTRAYQVNLIKPYLSKHVRYSDIDLFQRTDQPIQSAQQDYLTPLLGNLEFENLISIYIGHLHSSALSFDQLVHHLKQINQRIDELEQKWSK